MCWNLALRFPVENMALPRVKVNQSIQKKTAVFGFKKLCHEHPQRTLPNLEADRGRLRQTDVFGAAAWKSPVAGLFSDFQGCIWHLQQCTYMHLHASACRYSAGRVQSNLWASKFSLILHSVMLSPNLLFIGSMEPGDLTE